ncbi:GNAT family N-acetyltransferase [Aureimonas altamirensis]|uniref:GNAT family N-acetyltransferase n=1 Tax=Aureimonas altamirensis TaxID=370622 RepID=UPI002036BA09|nr:GNAT family N-acetyltransferase [Aureimonas altamirensis]MCM2502075.1 GNAT family N-acetyltransferase [Aureimonas altamirensis]
MIETERLILSPPRIEDFEDSLAMHQAETMALYTGGKLLGREDVWKKLLQRIGHWSAYGYGVFTARAKRDGSFIGEVGLAHFCRGFGKSFEASPEAAWMINPNAHGRGYAREAAECAHRWMAAEHAMSRSVCIIHPDNTASLRVSEALGYERIGEVSYRDARPLMFERFEPVPIR